MTGEVIAEPRPLTPSPCPPYCEKVKNVTVSLDEAIYHRARVAVAERLKRAERELRAKIAEFRGSTRLTRDQLHERAA